MQLDVFQGMFACSRAMHETFAALLVISAAFQSTEVATSAIKMDIPATWNSDALQGLGEGRTGIDETVDRSCNFRDIPRLLRLAPREFPHLRRTIRWFLADTRDVKDEFRCVLRDVAR